MRGVLGKKINEVDHRTKSSSQPILLYNKNQFPRGFFVQKSINEIETTVLSHYFLPFIIFFKRRAQIGQFPCETLLAAHLRSSKLKFNQIRKISHILRREFSPKLWHTKTRFSGTPHIMSYE